MSTRSHYYMLFLSTLSVCSIVESKIGNFARARAYGNNNERSGQCRNGACKEYCRGRDGDPGPQGIPGPRGPRGLPGSCTCTCPTNSHFLFAYLSSIKALPQCLPPDYTISVPFDRVAVTDNTWTSSAENTVFTAGETAVYEISYTLGIQVTPQPATESTENTPQKSSLVARAYMNGNPVLGSDAFIAGPINTMLSGTMLRNTFMVRIGRGDSVSIKLSARLPSAVLSLASASDIPQSSAATLTIKRVR
jgi:hypothetical protein